MQAIEVTGEVNAKGHLLLDYPLQVSPGRARVIVLLPEDSERSPQEMKSPLNQLSEQPAVVTGTRPIWERVADISAQIPAEEWAELPKDLSKNIDHYLYGSPKEDE
jgi:hypothetical protein